MSLWKPRVVSGGRASDSAGGACLQVNSTSCPDKVPDKQHTLWVLHSLGGIYSDVHWAQMQPDFRPAQTQAGQKPTKRKTQSRRKKS